MRVIASISGTTSFCNPSATAWLESGRVALQRSGATQSMCKLVGTFEWDRRIAVDTPLLVIAIERILSAPSTSTQTHYGKDQDFRRLDDGN